MSTCTATAKVAYPMSLNYRHAGYYWYLLRTGRVLDPVVFRLLGALRCWQIEATPQIDSAVVGDLDSNGPLPVVMLLGKQYVTDGLYALKSFIVNYPGLVRVVILDDGSLDALSIARLQYHLPEAQVVSYADRCAIVESYLNQNGYDQCSTLRAGYPPSAKIVDCKILFGDCGYLLLDSDTTSFKRLNCLANAIAELEGRGYVFLRDYQYSYCYNAVSDYGSTDSLPQGVNTGLAYIPAATFALSDVEKVLRSGAIIPGHWFREQTIYAVLAARARVVFLPSETYGIGPRRDERVNEFVHYCGDRTGPIRVALRRVGQRMVLRKLRARRK